MAQVNPENSTIAPLDSARRRFLTQTASVAAGGAILALAASSSLMAAAPPASPADAVYALIETHRAAAAAWLASLKAQGHLEVIDCDDEGDAAMDAFHKLVETAPTTLGGLVAWASYLDEIRQVEEWLFEEEGASLVVTLVEALRNLDVPS